MTFASKYAPLIWNRLFTVKVPDIVTMNPEYIKKFGVYISGDREVDEIMTNNLVMVKISIAKIVEYYEDGVQVQIPSREDMITIHKNIELYLGEWKEYLSTSINLNVNTHKGFILLLEKLSKEIYNKISSREMVNNLFTKPKVTTALDNPFTEHERYVDAISRDKPDYDGIGELVRSRSLRQSKQ